MPQKTGLYLIMAIFAAFAGGLYGILHDQISYTLSPEYFTRFKFIQFDIPWAYESPRLGAAWVGFLATWWMGALVFLPLGLFGFMFSTPHEMAHHLARSLLIVIAAALLTGILGFLYGCRQVTEETIVSHMQWVRPGVADPVSFVRAGYMHNAGYLGGLTGLFSGIFYLLFVRLKGTKN